MPSRVVFALALCLLPVAAVGCVSADEPAGLSAPNVAKVIVSSPIDTLIDLDRTVQLTATARDRRGRDVPVNEYVWRSSNVVVATVTASGLVKPVAVGSVPITAETGGVSGGLHLRIVQADLAGIRAVLDDPFTYALVTHLSSPVKTSMQSELGKSAKLVSSGNLVGAAEGLANAQEIVIAAADPNDIPLTAVLGLLLDHAQRLLNL